MEAAHRFEEGMVFLDQRFQGAGEPLNHSPLCFALQLPG